MQFGYGTVQTLCKARGQRGHSVQYAPKEHQILTTARAASFASQIWDRKVRPSKTSQHDFLTTCIDVDLQKNVQHAQWQRSLPLWKGATIRTIQIQSNQWSLEHCSVLCIIQFAAPFAQKCDHLAPPHTHTFLKRTSQISKSIHIPPPPPKETTFWRIGPKVHKTQE